MHRIAPAIPTNGKVFPDSYSLLEILYDLNDQKTSRNAETYKDFWTLHSPLGAGRGHFADGQWSATMLRVLFAVLAISILLPTWAVAQSPEAAYVKEASKADQDIRVAIQTLKAATLKPESADRLVVGLALADVLTIYEESAQIDPPQGRARSHALWMEEQRLFRDAAVSLASAIYGVNATDKADNQSYASFLLDQVIVVGTIRATVWAQGY